MYKVVEANMEPGILDDSPIGADMGGRRISIRKLLFCLVLIFLICVVIAKVVEGAGDGFYTTKRAEEAKNIEAAMTKYRGLHYVGETVSMLIGEKIYIQYFINGLYELSAKICISFGGEVNKVYKIIVYDNYNDHSINDIYVQVGSEFSAGVGKFKVVSVDISRITLEVTKWSP